MKKIVFTALAFLPIVALAQLDRSVIPSAGPAPTINIEDSKVFKTENGITVILSENHKIPKVSFQLSLGADPVPERMKAGASDIMGELVMSGTNSLDKDALDNKIDYIGARLSASSGGMFLSVLSKYRDQGLTLMQDILLNANFPQSEFDRVVKQMESALKSTKSEPGQMAGNANAKMNYPSAHPYSEIMTEESLADITLEDVKKLFKFKYVPDGSYLVIVGDITLEEAKAAVDKYFGSWTGGKAYKGAPLNSQPAQGKQVAFVGKPGAVQSVINVCLPMKVSPGDPDQIGLSVLNEVFGGNGFGTRLMQNLREDKAYTYGCYANQNIDEYGSLLTISGNFRNEVTDSAITQIMYEIEKITTELASSEELETTKAKMAGSFARSLENPQTIASFARNIEKYKLDKDYYKNYLKKLEAINKEDLLRLAKKYMSAENMNIIVVGNEDVLGKLTQFDSDGNIEKLDAFGNAVKEKKKADISADDLILKHVLAVTQAKTIDDAKKVIKTINSYERVIEYTGDKVPFPMVMTEVWKSPNVEGNKMEGKGMVFQKYYFDGAKGAMTNMQTGTKELADDEVKAKLKNKGIIPEMHYKEMGMAYELKEIEVVDGKDMYVLFTNDGKDERLDYFDAKSFMKMKSVVIQKEEEKSRTTEYTFGEYADKNGILVPGTINMMAGPMNLNGKVTSFKANTEVSLDSYK